jgi:hypothetical protein
MIVYTKNKQTPIVLAGYLKALCNPATVSDITYVCDRKSGFKYVQKSIQEIIKNTISIII